MDNYTTSGRRGCVESDFEGCPLTLWYAGCTVLIPVGTGLAARFSQKMSRKRFSTPPHSTPFTANQSYRAAESNISALQEEQQKVQSALREADDERKRMIVEVDKRNVSGKCHFWLT